MVLPGFGVRKLLADKFDELLDSESFLFITETEATASLLEIDCDFSENTLFSSVSVSRNSC